MGVGVGVGVSVSVGMKRSKNIKFSPISNIQHPTSNIQHPTSLRLLIAFGGCFLLGTVFGTSVSTFFYSLT